MLKTHIFNGWMWRGMNKTNSKNNRKEKENA